ncbi:glycosyltransferase family 39 protein [Frigoribacterium salinisoli]
MTDDLPRQGTPTADHRPAATTTTTLAAARGTALRRTARTGRLDAVLVGLVATIVGGALLWVPSVWYDEAATVVAATRSWSELWRTVQTVDIVHLAWYALMHVWFDLVGYSPTTLRLPSAVLTGVAAGLTVVLGRRLVDRRTGIVAGLLLAVLPRTTLMATEGRSFALSTMLAVALTLVLLGALDRALGRVPTRSPGRWRASAPWWAGYAVLAVASTWSFLYLALLLAAHAVTVLVVVLREGRSRASLGALAGFAAAGVVAAAATLPVALASERQSGQVGWIDAPSLATVRQFLVTQWSMGNEPFAWLMWAAALVGVVVAVRAGRRGRLEGLLRTTLPWLLVPTLTLLALSFVLDPLWSPRYQTFSSPALALLMAVGVTALPWRPAVAGVVVVAAALSAPTWVEQRQPTAKDVSAWDQVADIVAAERATEPEGTREGIVYGPVRRHPSATSRIIQYTYPDAFRGMDDLTLETPAAETGGLWEEQYDLEEVLDRVDDLDTVWLVTSDKQDWRPRVTELLATQGFSLDEQWQVPRTNVLLYRR